MNTVYSIFDMLIKQGTLASSSQTRDVFSLSIEDQGYGKHGLLIVQGEIDFETQWKKEVQKMNQIAYYKWRKQCRPRERRDMLITEKNA